MRARIRRGQTIGVPILAASLLLAACGGDGGTEEEPEEAAEAADPAGEEPAAEAPEEEPDASDDADAAEGEAADAEAGDWEPVWEDGVLQPLPDGFPEREIRVLNRRDPGHRDYTHMTALLESVGDKSPVEFVVENHTNIQWKTWSIIEIILSDEGCEDGYCISPLSVGGGMGDLAADPLEEELGLGFEDFQAIAAVEAHPYLLIQRADAEWGDTFEDFVAYAQENPNELLYASNEVGSGHDFFAHHIFNLFDIEVDKAPMPSQAEASTAVGAGEADISLVGYSALPAIQSDRATALLVTGPPDMDTSIYGGDVPTQHDFEEFDDQFWGVMVGWMAHRDTPDLHLQWLNELMQTVEEDEQFLQREEQFGADIDVWTVEETMEYAREAYEANQEIARQLGLHWEQQG